MNLWTILESLCEQFANASQKACRDNCRIWNQVKKIKYMYQMSRQSELYSSHHLHVAGAWTPPPTTTFLAHDGYGYHVFNWVNPPPPLQWWTPLLIMPLPFDLDQKCASPCWRYPRYIYRAKEKAHITQQARPPSFLHRHGIKPPLTHFPSSRQRREATTTFGSLLFSKQ